MLASNPSHADPLVALHPLTRRYRFFDWLAGRPFVERVILFGSRARGDQHDRSDIDLAVECPSASEKDWFDLVNDLDDTADTLLSIDLVRLDALSAADPLRAKIEAEGVDLYRRPS